MSTNFTSYSQMGGFGDSPAPEARGGDGARGPDQHIPVDIATFLADIPDSEDKLRIGGSTFANIVLLGKIVERDATDPIKLCLKVTDPTSEQSLDVQYFTSEAVTPSDFIEGMWVRVFGRARSFNGVRSMTAFKLVAVEADPEAALKIHQLEVKFARAYFTKDLHGKQIEAQGSLGAKGGPLEGTWLLPKPTQPTSSTASGGGGAFGVGGANSSSFMGGGGGGGMTMAPPALSTGGGNSLGKRIIDAIRHFTKNKYDGNVDHGVSVAEIQSFLPAIQEKAIRSQLSALSDEGEVYEPRGDGELWASVN